MLALKDATFRLLRIYLFQLVLGINSDGFSDIHQFNLTFDVFRTIYEVRMTLLYILFRTTLFFKMLMSYFCCM